MDRKGFTLIEVLVVLAVTALLSGLSIVYSRVGQSQFALSVESAKVAQLILEAKQLSIATYSQKHETCGYGVMFNYGSATTTYSLFEYDIATSTGQLYCPSLASTTDPGYMTSAGALVPSIYALNSWDIAPANGVKIVSGGGAASGTIQSVLFMPPDPFTLISFDGQTYFMNPSLSGGAIYLQTADGSASRVVSVNPAGQVNL